jgi:uncharacterized iron-regulated membrane protein
MTGEVQFALIVAALVGSFIGAFAWHLWTTRRRRTPAAPQPWRSPAEAEERFLG